MSEARGNLLNMANVAERLGCSKMHVYRLVQAGALSPVNISVPGTKRSRFRFTEEALANYIRRSEYLTAAQARAAVPVKTPQQVEARLEELDEAIEDAFKDLDEDEYEYHETKALLELRMAKSRIGLMTGEERMTVQQREDTALVANEELVLQMATAEAKVRGARANINRLRTQVDIARSMGAGMRAAMEM